LEDDVDHVLRRLKTLGALIGDFGPSAAASILIAEVFFKFHSFTLECVAFLATWFIVEQLVAAPYRFVRDQFRGRRRAA
jgi:hypothetical protein